MLPHTPQHHEPSFSSAPPQVLLEDLTLVIDVALLVAFATAVHLLRQKFITVAALAHALSVAFLVFTAGHYVERHVVGLDGVEDLVSRRGPTRGGRGHWWLASWPTAGLLSIGAVVALGARFWSCRGVCVPGGADPLHNRCKMMRLRFFAPVFSATVVFVYLCISSRLNALLGGSVLHPRGGGYALAVLVSPALLATVVLSGCASVWLYAVLVEEQASGNSVRYHPYPDGDGLGAAASRTKRQQRRLIKHAEDPAWGALYSNRSEIGDPPYQRHWSRDSRNNDHLKRQDSKRPPSSPRSLPGAREGTEADFEASSSSSFPFRGGPGVGGGDAGVAGFGFVGSLTSPPSSSASSKRWSQQEQQQQQQQRGLDGAAVAWDSGPRGGFRREGDSSSGGGGFAVRPSPSHLGGGDSRHDSDAVFHKSFPLRAKSESTSVLGGHHALGSTFRREAGGVTGMSVRGGGAVVAESAPNLGPTFLPLPGGVGTGGSRRFSAGSRTVIEKPLRPPRTVGTTNGWTSSSSSSSSSASSSPGRRRGGQREITGECRGRGDTSDISGSDDNSSDGGDDGGPRPRPLPPSTSRAKFIPSSFTNFEGGEESTRGLSRHRSSSSGSSSSSSNASSSGSSHTTGSEREEAEWNAVSSGRWARSPGESRPAGIKPAAGVHAAGWGGGGGNVGTAHDRDGIVGGRRFTVYNGSGRGGTAGGLVRRRPKHAT
eukprot:g1597.t1